MFREMLHNKNHNDFVRSFYCPEKIFNYNKVHFKEKFKMSDVLKAPNQVSDTVAEGVVNCLKELL